MSYLIRKWKIFFSRDENVQNYSAKYNLKLKVTNTVIL